MLPFVLRMAACVLAGCLLFLSCADFDIWPLAWCGIVPLLAVVLDERCQRPFLHGWVTGLVANGGGFYWINGLLMRFGHMPWYASLPLYLLLVAYQALTFGSFAWIVRHLRDATRLPVALLAPITMVALELLVPFVFPWYLAITQAWVRPVIQIADLTGPLGVTFLLVLVNAALYDGAAAWLHLPWLFRAPLSPAAGPRAIAWRPLAAALAVVAVALGYGQVRIRQVEARRAAAPTVQVGVVQANIGIHEKWVPAMAAEQLAVHQRLSKDLVDRGAELLVWPESSYPYAIDRRQQRDFPPEDRRQAMRGFSAPLVLGALTLGPDEPYPFNTALMMDQGGRISGSFDKNFLMVFGEYIPFYEHIKWVRQLIPEASNFARGEKVKSFPLETRAGHFRLGPMICYEDIIPAFGRRVAAERPHLFVNLTNDAWFGATSEPWEHMALSVYRAVEHRVDLVRAVNTGVSAFIDATGRVRDKGPAVDPDLTPDARPVTLLVPAAMLEPSGLYLHLGESFGLANLVALLALGVRARRQRGMPLEWAMVLLGTGAMLAMLALLAVVASPSDPGLAGALIAHRPNPTTDQTIAIGSRLLLGGAIGCLALGAVLSWLSRRFELARPPRVEAAAAVVGGLLLPTLLLGRMEGETAAIVFSIGFAVALTLGGMRLAAGRPSPAPAAASPPLPAPPSPGHRRRR